MTDPQGPRYAVPARGTDPAALAALAAACVVAPVGLVLGLLARRRIRASGEGGEGLALAAVVVGTVLTVLYAALLAAVVVLFVLVADTPPELGELPPRRPTPTPTAG